MKRSSPVFLLGAVLFFSCSKQEISELGSDWKSIQRDLQTRLITVGDSAVVEIPEGHFMFSKSLLVDGNRHLIIRGQGIDKTILSFELQEEGAEGFRVANGEDITLQDFTIENSKGDNIKVTDTKGITLRNIKSQWTGNPSETNGAYAFYPVLCSQVLIENCIAIGASDAGVYVGQSDSVTVRNNEAYCNVAGIESENSRWVNIYGNNVHDNTGGILIFDLPGLTQSGHTTAVYDNRVVANNFRNFAPVGNIVASVPPGTGIMLLATRYVELSRNELQDNRTVGVAIASYDIIEAMVPPEEGTQMDENVALSRMDQSYNSCPDEVYIHDNQFSNKYMFPSLQNDFGWLFLLKFPFATPDIVWDGIITGQGSVNLCVEQDKIQFGNLDAANDFQNLNTDLTPFVCSGHPVKLSL